ncbi:MAG: DUF554 domain-containing protein [Eubacteriales bacterium]|nr:DUF554 domain-containing protein [Eubacteriales bacterium]
MRYGAIINALAVIAGGVLGMLGGGLITEKIKETVLKANGMSVILIAISGVLSKMFLISDAGIESQGSIMLVVCLALGGIIGEAIDIDGLLAKFGEWLKIKTKSENDGGFIDAFVTTSIIVAVGAMTIIGGIEDGLRGDMTIYIVKSIIDFITVMVLAAAKGKGCVFAFVPVLVVQGGVTVLSGLLAPIMTTEVIGAISLVGNALIMGIGINLLKPGTLRVANLLPAVVLAALWAGFNLPMT